VSRRPRRGQPPARGEAAAATLGERLRADYPEASGRTIKQWLEHGRVQVGGRVVRRGDAPVAPGDRVQLGPPPPPPFPPELRLVHLDGEIVVVEKPPGLLTIATERERARTAYRLLADHLASRPDTRAPRHPLFIVHRLDRETSGLLVFARTPEAKRALQEQFERRGVERVYEAVVEGRVREDAGTLQSRLREDPSLRVRPARAGEGREAVTHFRVLARGAETTRLELRLETGRRGQIRAQLAERGHPIVGDLAYGSRSNPIRRVCLHATGLGFTGPGRRALRFRSPAPASFAKAERAAGGLSRPPGGTSPSPRAPRGSTAPAHRARPGASASG
jgi:23S rRNA pseudouridine1911/1915/1917 synthase